LIFHETTKEKLGESKKILGKNKKILGKKREKKEKVWRRSGDFDLAPPAPRRRGVTARRGDRAARGVPSPVKLAPRLDPRGRRPRRS
jgi:hypothetical protein